MSSNEDRRKFILQMAKGVGISLMGGMIWSAYLNEAKSAPLVLRPPASLNEDDFLSKCIKCGMCVENCPYDTLKLAKAGDNIPIGTPYFTPRQVPCYMCEDIPCVPVCPTGALDKNSVSRVIDTKREWDINLAKMGLAVVDEESCIAFWGIQCDACYRACPILDGAIRLEYRRNERTGKHAFLMPIVHSDLCTGCGLCERACVTEKSAIYVLPREVAMGKTGATYVKGWDKSDEVKKMQSDIDTENITTKTDISERDTQSYLNSEDLLDE